MQTSFGIVLTINLIQFLGYILVDFDIHVTSGFNSYTKFF